jgi:hypothetical protein
MQDNGMAILYRKAKAADLPVSVDVAVGLLFCFAWFFS